MPRNKAKTYCFFVQYAPCTTSWQALARLVAHSIELPQYASARQGMRRSQLTISKSSPYMPSPEAVKSFVGLVERGKTVEAMMRFYAEHASMQENAAAPRSGKAALIKHEEDALASIARMKATCVRPIFVSGDFVVIRWVFEIEDKKGKTVRFEELAHQRWDGNLMVQEQFFYDPAQLK